MLSPFGRVAAAPRRHPWRRAQRGRLAPRCVDLDPDKVCHVAEAVSPKAWPEPPPADRRENAVTAAGSRIDRLSEINVTRDVIDIANGHVTTVMCRPSIADASRNGDGVVTTMGNRYFWHLNIVG